MANVLVQKTRIKIQAGSVCIGDKIGCWDVAGLGKSWESNGQAFQYAYCESHYEMKQSELRELSMDNVRSIFVNLPKNREYVVLFALNFLNNDPFNLRSDIFQNVAEQYIKWYNNKYFPSAEELEQLEDAFASINAIGTPHVDELHEKYYMQIKKFGRVLLRSVKNPDAELTIDAERGDWCTRIPFLVGNYEGTRESFNSAYNIWVDSLIVPFDEFSQ